MGEELLPSKDTENPAAWRCPPPLYFTAICETSVLPSRDRKLKYRRPCRSCQIKQKAQVAVRHSPI